MTNIHKIWSKSTKSDYYLLNKIFNKFTQNNLFFNHWWRFQAILWKILGWLTRLGYLSFCFLRKFEIFSFLWLRRVFQQPISHRKAHLWAANSFNVGPCWPLKACWSPLFMKFWEKDFRWLRRAFQQLISHEKALVLVAYRVIEGGQ